jgi:hypothetical protein
MLHPSQLGSATAGRAASRPRWSFIEWLWRSRALRETPPLASPGAVRDYARRAEIAAELADRAFDPIDPLRSGSPTPLALSLYREAAYWALLAQAPAEPQPDLAHAFASVPAEVLVEAAGSHDELAYLRRALQEKSFVQSAGDDDATLKREARSAQTFVRRLVERAMAPERRVQQLTTQRWVRTAALVFTVIAVVVTGAVAIERMTRAPDLALGKSWRTSSKYLDCAPSQHSCGGADTAILFHTLEERDPWFEIDLGSPRRFSVALVENRKDCCMDRAIPLVIETSDDRVQWRERARRTQAFDSWRVRFAPVTARYVRARVLRRSMLHLESMVIRAK